MRVVFVQLNLGVASVPKTPQNHSFCLLLLELLVLVNQTGVGNIDTVQELSDILMTNEG